MFIKTDLSSLQFNPFDKIGRQWMLISACSENGENTMTASWGGLGFLWNRPAVTIYVRPQRYTHEFLESADLFSLSFLQDKYRAALNLCGSKSGRDCDKIALAGLRKVSAENTVFFEQSELVLICKKIYRQQMNPQGFIDPSIEKNYLSKDYHTIYIGEILQCLTRQTE